MVSPYFPFSQVLVSLVCIRVPGSIVVLHVIISIVFHGIFQVLLLPRGLGLPYSPGSSLPRGGRGVMFPAPMIGGAGRVRPSHALRSSMDGGRGWLGWRGTSCLPALLLSLVGVPRPPPHLRGYRVFPLWWVGGELA